MVESHSALPFLPQLKWVLICSKLEQKLIEGHFSFFARSSLQGNSESMALPLHCIKVALGMNGQQLSCTQSPSGKDRPGISS